MKHGDALGSVTEMTDGAGMLEQATSYEPFGSARADAKLSPLSPSSPMKFTGQFQDETGLYHLRARQYDPETGTFLSTDPLPTLGSAYSYVGGHPTVLVDPSGMRGEKLRAFSNFMAGWGDMGAGAFSYLPGGSPIPGVPITQVFRTYFGADDEVDYQSGAYFGGGLTGAIHLGVIGSRAGRVKAPQSLLQVPRVGSTKLQNIIDDLYSGATNPGRVGSGTTADAIRHELRTGQQVFGRSHIQKGEDYLRGLENWLKANPNAPYRDRLIARSLADDLLDALGRS